MAFEEYARNKKNITIPKKLKTLIEATGEGTYLPFLIQKNEEKTNLCYNKFIQGLDSLDELFVKTFKAEEKEPPVEITFSSEKNEKVEKRTRLLYEKAFGKEMPGKNIQRKIMLNAQTFPVKINCIEDELITETFYVKKPDTNRIVGLFLYNIISNVKEHRFAFNERIFVEEEVKGTNLLEIDEIALLTEPKYRENIGRAAAHAEFLGLFEDVTAARNIIVHAKSQQVMLFDFDAILEPRGFGRKENYIMQLYHQKGLLDQEMARGYRSEKMKIANRLSAQKDLVFSFAELADKLKDQEFRTIKDKVGEFSGDDGLKAYIIKQIRTYSH